MNTSRNFDVNRYSFVCHSTIITCTGGRDMHAGCILYGHNFVQGKGHVHILRSQLCTGGRGFCPLYEHNYVQVVGISKSNGHFLWIL